MTRQRTVFGAGELKALVQGWGQCGQYAQTDPSRVHSSFLVSMKFLFIQIE
jgi:hypothetical protein